MAGTPVVPASLVRPVPASQARSQVQELLDDNRERVERLSAAGQRQLVRQLVALEAELRDRLTRWRAAGRGDAWTARDTEACLVQVRELLGRQGAQFKAMLDANAMVARRLGVKNTVDVLRHFERAQKGAIRPLALDVAVAATDTLLSQHDTSMRRYGLRTIERVAAVLQRGSLAGDTFDEMVDRLTGARGKHGVVVESAGHASVIVRTEMMAAYNTGAHEEMLAQRAQSFDDLSKKLCETFDSRTAADSRKAHGEVRRLEEMFEDGAGRRYLYPPGRPCDRGVSIPWREAWGRDQAARPAS